ncbi:unnamed protein product [Brachionus calyciflorus]|uniref:N-acetyl-D-glucosamine kinase n=1 Tax=Brachionus calyciflorus TaxID=104777 RepID=A0A813Q280_9BILA|nr:unnamed protein product [Brachionus calyciflorus]
MKQIKLFCGIEGGGTKTSLSIIDEYGNLLAELKGGPSNPWLFHGEDGFKIVAKNLSEMIQEGLHHVTCRSLLGEGIYKLESVTCCLSGTGTKLARERLLSEFNNIHVNYKVFITNDSLSTIFTAFENGGIVLISGTGSNCVLVNPLNNNIHSIDDIETQCSGGWGNLLGDEGSAFWISTQLIKNIIKQNDNFLKVYDQEEFNQFKEIILEHFEIKSLREILPIFYEHRRIDKIASLTEKLAQVAQSSLNTKKALLDLFDQAGYELAKHVVSLQPKIEQSLYDANGLSIVCTGSVFKSWNLLKSGFIRGLQTQNEIRKFHLVKIQDNNSSIGACILSAKLCSFQIDFDLNRHLSILDVINI